MEPHLDPEEQAINRWRLVLGSTSDELLHGTGKSGAREFVYQEMDEVLSFLYDREYGEVQGYRQGGQGKSQFTVPTWISKVRELFPKPTIEILEKRALDRYGLNELLLDKKLLESLEPNMDLLKNIIQFKGRMKGDVLHSAKEIVRKVVEDLRRKLESEAKASIMGKKNPYSTSRVKSLRNLNFKKTITRNLKNYDKTKSRLVIDRIYFDGSVQPYNKWNIIIAVDESGSMMNSVIYSSVMASIFYTLNALKPI